MAENETHDFDQQQTGQEPDQMLKEERKEGNSMLDINNKTFSDERSFS